MTRSVAFAVMLARVLFFLVFIALPAQWLTPGPAAIVSAVLCGFGGLIIEWPFFYLLLWIGLVQDSEKDI